MTSIDDGSFPSLVVDLIKKESGISRLQAYKVFTNGILTFAFEFCLIVERDATDRKSDPQSIRYCYSVVEVDDSRDDHKYSLERVRNRVGQCAIVEI